MPRKKSTLLKELSTADLKRLLAARERIDVLESEKTRLEKELAKVEGELAKLMTGSGAASKKKSPAKKRAKKKVTKKAGTKTAKKTVKKTTRKAVRKKTGKKVGKKVSSKTAAKKKSVVRKPRRAAAGKKLKLEDVIVAVIKKNGGPVAFQDLKATIVKGKLFKTKSGNFDNVLRRTLSTSKAVKRVGRGIYDAA